MVAILQTELYFDNSDAEKNLDIVVLIACGSLAITKVTSFRIWPTGFICNFTSAVRDYDELRGEVKRAIVRKHAYMGRMACILTMAGAYASATLVMAVPVLVGEKLENIVNATVEKTLKYPIPCNSVMTFVKMPNSLYFVVFVTEYFMMIVTCTGNIGNKQLSDACRATP